MSDAAAKKKQARAKRNAAERYRDLGITVEEEK